MLEIPKARAKQSKENELYKINEFVIRFVMVKQYRSQTVLN